MMRESEDHVEFKRAQHNYPFNGGSHTEPRDRRHCVLGYIVALANERGGLLVLYIRNVYNQIKNGEINLKNGEVNRKKGTLNAKNGTVNLKNGTVNLKNGTLNSENGEVNPKNGTVNLKNGEVNQKNGTVNSKNGEINRKNGTVNLKNGEINQKNGTVNSKNGEINRKNGTLNDIEDTKKYIVSIYENKDDIAIQRLLCVAKDTIRGTIKDRDLFVLAIIAQENGVNSRKLGDRLCTQDVSIRKLIARLSKSPYNLIERRGSDKTGGYYLTETGLNFIEALGRKLLAQSDQ